MLKILDEADQYVMIEIKKYRIKYNGKLTSVEKSDGAAYMMYADDLELEVNDETSGITKKNIKIQFFTLKHDEHSDNLSSFKI